MASSKSPAESDGFKVPSVPASQLKNENLKHDAPQFPALNYKPPANASVPKHKYTLEVIKDGQVVEEHDVSIDKSFFTFGRLPVCDFPMEHGSISRYHAVLQFTDSGSAYLHDLSSSHGTLVNKIPVVAGVPKKIEIGDQIRFGVSSRIWVMSTSDSQLIEAQEAARHSAIQQKNLLNASMAEAVAKQSPGKNVFSAESEARPASWGIDDDGYGSAQRHEWRRNPSAAYLRDPVRYLKEFLIEMNCPYEPEIQSKSDGDGDGDVADDDSGFSARKQAKPREITVRITLPVDNASGNALYGIGQSLRKKEAERLACLDALDELDKNGYLNSHDDGRSSRREKRRSNKQESDDEFEDEFYDRTKTASKRRSDNKPETFESLSKKLQMAERDIEQMQRDIDTLNNSAVDGSSKEAQEEDGDELDVYMNALEKGQQVSARKQMEGKLAELEKEKARLAALLKLVAPDEPVVSKKRECREIQVERAEVQEPASGQAEPGPEPKRQRQSHGPTLRQVVDSQKQADKASFEERTREAKHEDEAGYHQDSETVEWQPPAGQTGDGRTSLNDKLGY